MESQSSGKIDAVEKRGSGENIRSRKDDSSASKQADEEEAECNFILPFWKRSLDLCLVVLIVSLLLPLLVLICVWIKLTSEGPVLFQQKRIGLNGVPFAVFKFRSMRVNGGTGVHVDYFNNLVESNEKMVKLDLDDERLIRGAKLLRAGGLDELPQLLNVIRGDMSLVGPRPCTIEEDLLYSDDQRRRFGVLPGISGYWQVKGKNQTTFTEMVEMDEYYADNFSLCLDLLIILRTPAVLFLQTIDLIEFKICKFRGSKTFDNWSEDS